MLVWTLQAPLKRLLASSQHTPLSLLPNLTARPYLRVPSPRIPDALGLDHERSSIGGKEGGPNRGSIFPHMRTLGHPDGKVLSRDCLSLIPCLFATKFFQSGEGFALVQQDCMARTCSPSLMLHGPQTSFTGDPDAPQQDPTSSFRLYSSPVLITLSQPLPRANRCIIIRSIIAHSCAFIDPWYDLRCLLSTAPIALDVLL